MNLLPVSVNIQDRPVLVIGGGSVALRKIRRLIRFGARVVVVSPELLPPLSRLAASGRILWKRSVYRGPEFKSVRPVLAFACTDSPETNRRVVRDAATSGTWINSVDSPDESSIHIPATARIGGVTLAIFSGGLAPVFVTYLRKRIEQVLGPKIRNELHLLVWFRRHLREKVSSPSRRKRILTRLVEDGTLDRLAALPPRHRRPAMMRCLEDRV